VATGVIVSASAELREGKHPSAPSHPLPEGIEVRLMGGGDGELVRIELANGLQGWIPSDAIEPI
jgi:hypothetical protein